VTAGAAGQVAVEGVGGRAKRTPEPPAGMHSLDVGQSGLDAQEDHNVVTIQSMNSGVVLQVPANSSLQLRTVNGGQIEVTGISGEIEAENVNGGVRLKNVSGSVVASSQNGAVVVALDRVAAGKPMAFTT